jgi:hypothetical protein
MILLRRQEIDGTPIRVSVKIDHRLRSDKHMKHSATCDFIEQRQLLNSGTITIKRWDLDQTSRLVNWPDVSRHFIVRLPDISATCKTLLACLRT